MAAEKTMTFSPGPQTVHSVTSPNWLKYSFRESVTRAANQHYVRTREIKVAHTIGGFPIQASYKHFPRYKIRESTYVHGEVALRQRPVKNEQAKINSVISKGRVSVEREDVSRPVETDRSGLARAGTELMIQP